MTSDRIITLAGMEATGSLTLRGDIFAMTEAASAAVLTPTETGAFSHSMRAALAARIARLNGLDDLAEHYGQRIGDNEAILGDPSFDGGHDDRLRAVLAFTDRVATSPKDATSGDIKALSRAGLSEPDIVRLTQLNAFLAYEIRLVDGLRLMGVGT